MGVVGVSIVESIGHEISLDLAQQFLLEGALEIELIRSPFYKGARASDYPVAEIVVQVADFIDHR